MQEDKQEVSTLVRCDRPSLDPVEIIEDRPDNGVPVADVVDAFSTIFAAVSAGAKAHREQKAAIARDRVLVPQIRVGDVVDAVQGLRARSLNAVAGACGTAANRLTAAQEAIRSKAEDKS